MASKLTTMPTSYNVDVYDKFGNKTTKRYYSSVDALIYFRSTRMEEIVAIQWNVDQKTMPLYGYNSYTFDYAAQGIRLITGTFIINYTTENYIGKLVAGSYDDTSTKSNTKVSNTDKETYKKTDVSDIYNQDDSDTLYKNAFDIYISYGNETDKYIRLKDVIVTGYTTGCSANGSPILENYNFIARDILYSK